MCFSRNISFYYCEGVGHGTLFCADEGTNPETAAVDRFYIYICVYVYACI